MLWYLVITLLLSTTINALPKGAPTSVCLTMKPFHGGGIDPQTDPSPFIVLPEFTQLAENSKLKVTVGSRQGIQFGGIMLHARTVEDGELIGTFVTLPAGTKTIECLGPQDTVTHTSPDKKGPQLDFEWQPPEGYKGTVIFNATVAQDYATFWVGIESEPVRILPASDITGQPQTPSTPFLSQSNTPPHYIPTTEQSVGKEDDPFYKGCFQEKGCFGAPDGCIRSKNCKAAVATTVRGDRYEFELLAPKEAAYVAFGLSDDNKMGDDSVVECVRDQNGGVKAYMSRTIPRNNLGVERLPNSAQDQIELLNFDVTDGELRCKVFRKTQTKDNGREYNLVNDRYNLLVASGKQVNPTKVGYHNIAYLPAGESRYLSDVSEVAGASKILLRLHGAFMLIAWVGTASVGILLARYFRQTWVGNQICGKDQWFAWHRFFMVCTWSLTVIAAILIFVEIQAWSEVPHAIFGVVTTAICFIQPIGAFFRPHPGTPRRSIFNWLHWLGGNLAHIFAIVTIFFAVKLEKAELPEWMDWILVGFVAFHVCIHLVFSILGCISDRAAESRITSFPMKDLGSNGRSSHNFDRKPDAPNSGLRKVLLGVYLLVIILFVVAMVIVTVYAPIEESWDKLRKSMTDKS